MDDRQQKIYQFDDFRLQTEDGTLLLGGERVPVTQKAIEMLTVLLENSGRVVPREAIIERLWPDTYVDENNLSVTVSMLRKAFGKSSTLIETIPRKGYRFNGDVRVLPVETVTMREFTRTVVERTEMDDEAIHAIAQLQTRTSRQRFLLAAVAFSVVLLVGVIGWSYYRGSEVQPAIGRKIAVVPFRDLSQDDDSRQFAIGLTDSLITKLAGLSDLIVRPTSSVLPFADDPADHATIRERLRVENFVEGTIQRSRGRVRVSVQFVRAADGAVLWADTFEEAETDLLKLQDLIAAKVFSVMSIEVSPKQKEYLAKRESSNAEANSLYLKGRFYWNKRNSDNLKKAVEYFEQAVAKDPTFALGFVGLSDAYQNLSEYGGVERKAAMEKARAAVTRAIELNPQMGEAYCSLAYLQTFYDWDFDAADDNFRKAIELSPNYATGRQWYGEYLLARGRTADALREQQLAAELDPLSPIILTDIAAIYYVSREYDKAIEAAKKVDDIAPRFPLAHYFLAMSYAKSGRETEAIRAYYIADSSWLPGLQNGDEDQYLSLGMRGLAEKRYRDVTTPPISLFMNGYQKAMGAAGIGDKDAAFRYLEESLSARDRWFINLRHDPHWDDVRDDPRFVDLLRRSGLGG